MSADSWNGDVTDVTVEYEHVSVDAADNAREG
jgi:hypothetical protein